MHISHFQCLIVQLAAYHACWQKISLGSSRRYIASNFTDVIVNTQLHHERDPKKCSKQAAAEMKYIIIPMPMKGLRWSIYVHSVCSSIALHT